MLPHNLPSIIRQEYPDQGVWAVYSRIDEGYLGEAPDVLPGVIAYSQRDERWAGIHLGGSSYTMGGAGCAVTAVTMLATLVKPVTPRAMVEWLNLNNGFAPGGLLYWQKAAEFGGLTFVSYEKWHSVPADVDKVKAALERNPQVLQVDFNPGGALNTHFVLALGLTEDGSDIEIVDPWTGERGTLLNMYGAEGWTLERAIYALVEFEVS